MNVALIILLIIFLSCIFLLTKLKDSNETFLELTNEERNALNEPFDSKKNQLYINILTKYNLPISPLDKKNYCDVRGLFQKNCDVKLTYTNK